MSIRHVEFLEDRIRAHYHLRKPYGIPDDNGILEVLYADIPQLTKPPAWVTASREWKVREEWYKIFVPVCGFSIVFYFEFQMENTWGPSEEDIYGPYLDPEGADCALHQV